MNSIDEAINKRYAEMLLRKAIPLGECLNCHRPAKNGYPKLGPNEYAHRFIYSVLKGDPGNLFVRHKCDNNLCINPEHLILGTHADNMADMAERKRGRGGGRKPRSFTIDEENKMFALSEEGYSQRQIAAMFNTSQAMVSMSIKRHGERNG